MSYRKELTPKLVIRHTGQAFLLTERLVTFGRQADNTIVLADPQASRHHAAISWQGGTFVIQDLGSANGTHVNERRVTAPQPLHDGDVIRTGNTLFDVRLPPVSAHDQLRTASAAPVPVGSDLDTLGRTMPVPSGDPARGARHSALPILVGVLLAGIVIVGLTVVVMLLLLGGQ